MGKYFVMQLKRLLRVLPLALVVVGLLFGALTVVYGEAGRLLNNSDKQVRLKVGVVGTLGDRYMELGLAALESFDATRMTLKLVQMEEADAVRAMERGDIAAFLVVPEGFLESAMQGKMMPLKFVSTSGSISLVALLKNEITKIVDDLLLESQKGIYGAGEALVSQGKDPSQVVNDISLEYVEFIFNRSDAYRVRYIGIGDGLRMEQYLLCGLFTLLLMLTTLPFAPMLVRRDLSLDRMACAQRRPVSMQAVCDYGAYLVGFLAVLAVLLGCIGLLGFTGEMKLTLTAAVHAVPIVIMLTAMSFLLYTLSGDLISGVLLQFFAVLALGFLSGCLYPLYFFPEKLQRFAAYLPTAIARSQLSGCITGNFSAQASWTLLGYGAVFFGLSVAVRKYRVSAVRG